MHQWPSHQLSNYDARIGDHAAIITPRHLICRLSLINRRPRWDSHDRDCCVSDVHSFRGCVRTFPFIRNSYEASDLKWYRETEQKVETKRRLPVAALDFNWKARGSRTWTASHIREWNCRRLTFAFVAVYGLRCFPHLNCAESDYWTSCLYKCDFVCIDFLETVYDTTE